MKSKMKTKQVGKGMDTFRAQFDKSFIIPQKIEAGLKKLGDGWETETEFAKLCGISLLDLGHFREKYEGHYVVVERTKRVWVGTKAMAKQMRELL